MGFNTLDIIFLILTGASILYSLIRGFVREIFSLLALIFGFIGASYGYAIPAGWLEAWGAYEVVAKIIAFIALLILLAFIVSWIGKGFSRLVQKMDLSWADRAGGAAFGFLKAMVLIAILLLVLTAFLPPKTHILSESKVSPAALSVARALLFFVPEDLRNLYVEKEKDLKEYWGIKGFIPRKNKKEEGKNADSKILPGNFSRSARAKKGSE
jgi:membrane protein required for colicin V production